MVRFAKPKWVRVDVGLKFWGAFQGLYDSLGIDIQWASGGHPRSNSQVEYFNKEIKKAIHKYAAAQPSAFYWDWLHDILIGLRMVASRTYGNTSFTLLCKECPILPCVP